MILASPFGSALMTHFPAQIKVLGLEITSAGDPVGFWILKLQNTTPFEEFEDTDDTNSFQFATVMQV